MSEIINALKIINKPVLRFSEFSTSWKSVSINKLITEYRLGGNYSNSEIPTDLPLIKMGNIDRGSINTGKLYFIEESEVLDEKDRIYYGDLFFNTRNTLDLVGKVAIWRDELPIAYYNSNLLRISFDHNFFMNYRFNSSNGIKKLRRLATGTTSVAAIYTKDLLKLKFFIPEIAEQQKIASFLSPIDKLIKLLEKKKTKLEEYKKSVMQNIFNREIRFTYANGKEFPEWDYIQAKNIFKSHTNKNHNGDLPVLSASQEKGMVLRNENGIQIQVTKKSLQSYKIVEKGDFVISLRSFQGGIEYSNLYGICSPAYIILKPKKPIYNQFYKQYLKKDRFIERLSKTVIGIRDGKQITYDAFGGLKIFYPVIEEQIKIATFLSSIDDKIIMVEKQIDRTEKFKKGLLQQMFV